MNDTIRVFDLGSSLTITGWVVVPRGEMESPVNLIRDEVMGTRSLSASVYLVQLRSEGLVKSEERVSDLGKLGVGILERTSTSGCHGVGGILGMTKKLAGLLRGFAGGKQPATLREKGLSPSLGRLLSSRDVLTKTFARVVRLRIFLRHRALLAPRNIVKLHVVVDESARLGSTCMRKIVYVSREEG
ncbi:hypothetical protein B296_00040670 [Ensete ventricosum]|uniref:Uncharacterized protein n=1 Tax=Ensete ventricosum TaxID=4639 RepID=A0A426ZJ21_ENSVE|nr:hypothetical protein B296_00040670 [Ensete ventricosum]